MVNREDWTTVTVRRETADRIKSLRIVDREPIDSVINRVLDGKAVVRK